MTRDEPPATARDRHLFAPGPKRILAIDGGGLRGAIAIAFLEEIEKVLGARAGHAVRLCDYFDLIGGTSSGAIIASGLALGYSAGWLHQIYSKFSAQVFHRTIWHIPGLQPRFDSRIVEREIRAVVGERNLDTDDLLTGLAVITKRLDTGSPWIISNNPRGRFWESPADGAYIGNRQFSLVNLIRASTAAPGFFAPQTVTIAADAPPGLFIDGGMTPHRSPALQLLMLALLDGHALNWQAGADQLMIVSVGTGSFRQRLDPAEGTSFTAAGLAVRALTGLMDDSDALSAALLHWFSGSPSRWPLNLELGTLMSQKPPFGAPLFTFRRYDIHLEMEWLRSELGIEVDEAALQRLRRIDLPDAVPELVALGRTAASQFVDAADFPAAFDDHSAVANR